MTEVDKKAEAKAEGDVAEKKDVNTGEVKQALDALVAHKENQTCADCDNKKPEWACSNHGTLICIQCSGVHRSLGTHISFVRSLHMDKWELSAVQAMKTNEAVNKELEYHVPKEFAKPVGGSQAKDRVAYIMAKYKDRLFIKSEAQPDAKAPVFAVVTPEEKKKGSDEPGMVVTAGILLITLVSGTNLKNMDMLSQSDPFVEFSNGRQTVHSKTITDSNNPDFKNERLSLSMISTKDPVSLKVYDVDPTGNELMGAASVDISKLKHDTATEVNVALDTKGSIKLILQFTPL